jgi:enoyl-CoA hydratase/carnithine racemase
MLSTGEAADYETLLVEIDRGVALVTLNRPDQMNAMTRRMLLELGHAFTALEVSDAVRVIVVTGAGRAFCAGAALGPDGVFAESAATPGVKGARPLGELRPWRMATPILAAINGAAVGGGITYPLLWDVRVAAEDAKIGLVFTQRGVIPEANSLWLISRLVGSRALEVMLTGRVFTGAEAAEMGLVTRAVPQAQVLSTTLDLAYQIAERAAPAAVAATKRLFYEYLETVDRIGSRDRDRRLFQWFLSTPDAREGTAAFLEKRPAHWSMSKRSLPDELGSGES